jgi:hypothetical protein
MERRAVMRRDVDWPTVRASAEARASDALTPRQTYDAIRLALSSLGDRHSGFIEEEVLTKLAAVSPADNPPPRGVMVAGMIGYLEVRPVVAPQSRIH